LGISQLNHLPDRNAKRSRVASWYGEKLASLKEHLHVPSPQEGVDISWFVYVVRLADKYTAKDCHQIIEYLRKNGIGCSNYFPCIHLQKFYKELYGYKGGEFPIAESISDRSLALPFSSLITEEEVAQIASILENYFSQASS
jgi:perosamine synthetase